MALYPFAGEECPAFAEGSIPIGEVTAIQFVLEGDEETLQTSCFDERETIVHSRLTDNGLPVPNGLYDDRMGQCNERVPCGSCGRKKCGDEFISCIGHISHMHLYAPVFQTEFLSEIIYGLNSVCYKCSEFYPAMIIRYQQDHPEEFLSKNYGRFENFICRLTLKGMQRAKRINEELTRFIKKGFCCPNCGSYGRIWSTQSPFVVYSQVVAPNKQSPKCLVSASVAETILGSVNEDVWQVLGFAHKTGTPKASIIQVLPIPPPHIRPHLVISDNNMTCNHELTQHLLNIVTINTLCFSRMNYLRHQDHADALATDRALLILTDLLQGCCALYWSGDSGAGPLADQCRSLSSNLPVNSWGGENASYFDKEQNNLLFRNRFVNSSSSSSAAAVTSNSKKSRMGRKGPTNRRRDCSVSQQKKRKAKTQTGGGKQICLSNILPAKDGIFRHSFKSNRTQYGGRGVLGIDPDARPDEVVLPGEMAMVCLQSKRVCSLNQKLMTRRAILGPQDPHGAKRLHRDDCMTDSFALDRDKARRMEFLKRHSFAVVSYKPAKQTDFPALRI